MIVITTPNTPAVDVSVIVPTYNRITMLTEALKSLYAQEYDGTVEIIVIDDNSQDGTSQIIREKYPGIRLIALSKNGGPSAARNCGIKAAAGKYIAFLDSDDLWEPTYLNVQVSALNEGLKHQRTHFSVSDIWIWETEKNHRYEKSQKPKEKYSSALHHLLSGGSFVSTPSAVVFPCHVLKEVGLFDEALRFGEDTDLYTRAIAANFTPIFTEEPLVTRRKHSSGQAISVENIEQRIQNRLRAAKKYYPLLKKELNGIEIRVIFAEVFADFSKYYYRDSRYISWLKLLLISTRFSSPYFAIKNMKEDIKSSVKQYFKGIRKRSGIVLRGSTNES